MLELRSLVVLLLLGVATASAASDASCYGASLSTWTWCSGNFFFLERNSALQRHFKVFSYSYTLTPPPVPAPIPHAATRPTE